MRPFGLLHLLGQASLRMEQALWPEDYERMTRKVKGVQREAEGDNAKSFSQGHQKLALPLFAEWPAEASVAWDVSRVEPA